MLLQGLNIDEQNFQFFHIEFDLIIHRENEI